MKTLEHRFFPWESLFTSETWIKKADSQHENMRQSGYSLCAGCGLEWRRSHEGRQQRKHRLRYLGGRKGRKPWIYPIICYSKGGSCKDHPKSLGRDVLIERATPKWADQEKIARIYIDANKSGKHVDHIIPLRGKMVCGLHVENNLQAISASLNFWKSNRLFESHQNGK